MPSYKLHYFNGRGRAEVTRLLFAAAGVEYVDNRITDWPAPKAQAPLGQLPYLEIDGVAVPQSLSIARYVAREYNLAGKSNLQQAQADAIVDTATDCITHYYNNVFFVKDEALKAEAMSKFLADQGTKGGQNLEKLIGLYGSNGYSVGDSLTWADLVIYDHIVPLLSKIPNFAETFPKIAAVNQSVNSNEKIAQYIKSRPETPF